MKWDENTEQRLRKPAEQRARRKTITLPPDVLVELDELSRAAGLYNHSKVIATLIRQEARRQRVALQSSGEAS